MWRSSVALAVAVLALPLAARQGAPAAPSPGLVRLYVSAIGPDGQPVKNLTESDFSIGSDGRRSIVSFSKERQPVTATLMLDMSNSGPDQIEQLQLAGAAFVDALLPGDRMRIGTFGSEVWTTPLLTADRPYLLRVLSEELWPGGPTPLWPAVDAAMASLRDEPGRRAIAVFTDGSQYLGMLAGPSRAVVEDRLLREGFILYTVTYTGWVFDYGIRSVATRSGGRNFELGLDSNLNAAFARIVTDLQQQYVLEFSAIHDGKAHNVEVQINRPGITALTRTAYVAR